MTVEDPRKGLGVGELPEGVVATLDFYITSDSSGLEAVMSIKGLTVVPDFRLTPDLDALVLIKAAGGVVETLREIADDWRMMTRAEVGDYNRRKREEEAEDRRREAEDLEE